MTRQAYTNLFTEQASLTASLTQFRCGKLDGFRHFRWYRWKLLNPIVNVLKGTVDAGCVTKEPIDCISYFDTHNASILPVLTGFGSARLMVFNLKRD